MTGHILNFGSINIDHVYHVSHFVRPGETLASRALASGLGGKGANQSVAIAKAGGKVSHIGRINHADQWAKERMASLKVDVNYIELVDEPSGHAIIQVDDGGENAIVLHGGANQTFVHESLAPLLESNRQSLLLMQNECSQLDETIHLARELGMRVALNPAPMTVNVRRLPLAFLDTLIVNQGEAQALSGKVKLDEIVTELRAMLPNTRTVITLGARSALMLANNNVIDASANAAEVVDTTGAGDTFVGYFLAGLADELPATHALQRACNAAAIAVGRAGAISSIPDIQELS